jgi:hypothetical protein
MSVRTGTHCCTSTVNGWLVKLGGRWVAKLVARLLDMAALRLCSNPDISQKYKMGDISKLVANIPLL